VPELPGDFSFELEHGEKLSQSSRGHASSVKCALISFSDAV
jgi:hypothetical protein